MMYFIELLNFVLGFKYWNIILVVIISNYVIILYCSCIKNYIYNFIVFLIICFIYFQMLGYLFQRYKKIDFLINIKMIVMIENIRSFLYFIKEEIGKKSFNKMRL